MNINDNENIESLKMERLHLRIIDNTIDVLYRPNHTYLEFLPNNEEGLKKLKEIVEYSREEFVLYLSYCNSFPIFRRDMIQNIKDSKLEEWYQGAWKMQTNQLLNKIGLKNPIEKPIFSEEILEYK